MEVVQRLTCSTTASPACRIINYCDIAGDRLIGIPSISVYNIPNAIRELERCRDAGLRGAMIWQAPRPDLPLYNEHYNQPVSG